MLRTVLLVCALVFSTTSASALSLTDIKDKLPWNAVENNDQKEAEYMLNIKKEEAKDRYIKKKLDRDPTGYMTVDEYEMLSVPKDKRLEDVPVPKPDKPYEMQFVPEPTYEIVRYNNPPGSPEISLGRNFRLRRQQNIQGIIAPDYSFLVYPSVYHYPKNGVVACDLFVIPLDTQGNLIARIKKANTMHRDPDPILSTEKSLDNFGAFRTLTPIDFSADGRKLLVKEKIGSKDDGIWQTQVIVYDFDRKTTYKLVELRDAIVYYWNEYKNLPLNDYRWDIYPLGFDLNEPDRVVVASYAYTGGVPIFLGNWSIDILGERAKLLSLSPSNVQVSMNGFKMIQSGVVPKMITDIEQKQLEKEAVAETDKTAGSTAYRLSWLNGTAQEKSYTVMAAYYDGDTKVSEEVVQEIKMAPYADGVAMGVVEHKQEGKTMQLYLQDNNAAAGGATNPGTEAPENATVPETAPATDTGEQPSNNMLVIIIAAAAVVVVAVIVVIVVSKKKKAAPKIPETAEENTEE